jgi:hypothetical protein
VSVIAGSPPLRLHPMTLPGPAPSMSPLKLCCGVHGKAHAHLGSLSPRGVVQNAATARLRWSRPQTLSSEPWQASGRCSGMDTVTIIGLFAAFCTTISYFPQLKKCWQTGSAGDLSLKTFASNRGRVMGSLRFFKKRHRDHLGECHQLLFAPRHFVLQAARAPSPPT